MNVSPQFFLTLLLHVGGSLSECVCVWASLIWRCKWCLTFMKCLMKPWPEGRCGELHAHKTHRHTLSHAPVYAHKYTDWGGCAHTSAHSYVHFTQLHKHSYTCTYILHTYACTHKGIIKGPCHTRQLKVTENHCLWQPFHIPPSWDCQHQKNKSFGCLFKSL